MSVKLSIGDFSRMTHLSVKALRHYHEVGLLEPADIDRDTGYRSYAVSQVATAQVIRRFRDLGMPLEQVKAVLTSPDVAERNRLIVRHLKQMESNLERTQTIVASLRTLLEEPPSPVAIEYRSVPAVQVAAISSVVDFAHLGPWFAESYAEIKHALHRQRITPAGAPGGLFPTEIFTDEVSEITVFVPVAGSMAPSGNVVIRELPPVELAIAVHRGSLSDVDRTFGLLGAHVLERAISVDGAIREYYIVAGEDVDSEDQRVTEIGWPIFRTTPKR
jgi:DNA-binding transcriptional MerR regulator